LRCDNALALIDKPILEMLQISAEKPLELSTNGDQILATPCRDKARQKKLAESLKSINQKFRDDLRRLAQ
jgi:antitoxin component of MazEF toxin-antitoxin module